MCDGLFGSNSLMIYESHKIYDVLILHSFPYLQYGHYNDKYSLCILRG